MSHTEKEPLDIFGVDTEKYTKNVCWDEDWCGPHVKKETRILVLHGLLKISVVIVCVCV